jgi:hypothetical protein
MKTRIKPKKKKDSKENPNAKLFGICPNWKKPSQIIKDEMRKG